MVFGRHQRVCLSRASVRVGVDIWGLVGRIFGQLNRHHTDEF